MADIAILPKSSKHGAQFEQVHVQKVYDEIASSVNDIQHKAWPNVKRFLKKFEPGSLVADIGCGNGRYLSINKKTYKVGIDVCQPLVDKSRSKGFEVAYADNLQTPFRDGMFDGVVSIGVIHHFCSSERRIKAIRELTRILRPGGRLMLYVWAYEQKHRKFDSQDVLIPWHEGLKEIKRAGSTSSRHSSISGMSSTSSVSEDESLDQFSQSKDNDSFQGSPRSIPRKSSVSLEDLTHLRELSNFKSSYYSLDFSGSPVRTKNKNCDKISEDENSNLEYLNSTATLISECRKFEASLRAMSTGCLDEMRRKGITEELKREINDITTNDKTNCQVHSLEQLNQIQGVVSSVDKAISMTVGETQVPNKDETGKVNIRSDSQSARLTKGNENIKSCKNQRVCSKVNPFLKQNSLDPYTFNDVPPINTLEETESLVDLFEVQDAEEVLQDEVFVNFKPETTKSKAGESSFFSTVKSKFFKLFENDKSASAKRINKHHKSFDEGYRDIIEVHPIPRSLTKPELSKEQLDIASELNFKVREFPLSSCPEVIHESPIEEIPDYRPQSKGLRGIHQEKQGTDILESNVIEKQVNKRNGVAVTSKESCQNKCEDLDESSVHQVEVIYDGYMKISLDKENEEECEDPSALNKEASSKSANEECECKCENFNIKPGKNVWTCKRSNKNQGSGEHCLSNGGNHLISGQLCQAFARSGLKPSVTSSIDDKDSDVYEENFEMDSVYQHKLFPRRQNSLDNDSIFEPDDNFSSKLCRFYHVFREGELESLILNHVTDLHIVQCFYDHANWCVIAEKTGCKKV